MSDDFLSQEELDALLKGLTSGSSEQATIDENISKLVNASIEGFSIALNAMIGYEVEFTKEEQRLVKVGELAKQFPEESAASTTQIKWKDTSFPFLIFFEKTLASTLADIMVGGTGDASAPLDEIRMSALNEVVNQMMGSAATSISKTFSLTVSMDPPVTEASKSEDYAKKVEGLFATSTVSFGVYSVKLDGREVGKVFLVLPASIPGESRESQTTSKTVESVPNVSSNIQEKKEKAVKVSPVEFEELQPSEISQHDMSKLELLLDVPLTVSVELGRTKMTLKQVLELYSGSIIELDKLTGEPVDVLVNGRIIARGEVVVVDENFAVRITEIVSPKERLTSLR